MIIHVIVTLVIVVIIALVINAFEDCSNNENSISLFRANGIPIISFKINKEIKQFVLDTGATYSVIDASALDKIPHVLKDSDITIFGIDGNAQNTSTTKIKLVHANGKLIEQFQVLDLADAIKSFNDANDTEVIGFIGSDFLNKHNCTIAYKTNTLTWCKLDE